MNVYLIQMLFLLGITFLTWIPKLATTPSGILDIVPAIFRTAQNNFFNLSYQGFTIIAFAFFIYSFVGTEVLQRFFNSRQEKIKKKKNQVIIFLTLFASIMGALLGWYDELILFYPLVIPLFLSLGLDNFTLFLCFFSGSSVGLVGYLSPNSYSPGAIKNINQLAKTNFNGLTWISIRLICWFLFTVFTILFNVWYANKKRTGLWPKQEENKTVYNKENKTGKNIKDKFIFLLFFLFIIGSILSQFGWIAKKIENGTKGNLFNDNKRISGSYQGGLMEEDGDWATGKEYENIGEIIPENSKKIKIAEEKTAERKPYWSTFGNWGSLQICSWFVFGAILICLLSKQNVFNVLIESIKKTVPVFIVFILGETMRTIMVGSGMTAKIKELIITDKITANAGPFALIIIFLLFFALGLFFKTVTAPLFTSLIPALVAISPGTAIFGLYSSWLGKYLAYAFSPNNGILFASLEIVKTSYKQYLKKTWPLLTIIFLSALLLVGINAFYIVK